MSKTLILAEKPSLARDIASALEVSRKNANGHFEDGNIIIAPLSGHLLEAEYDMPAYTKENLPLKGLESPRMVPKSNDDYIKNRVKSVLAELHRGDLTEIVSAGDADQEGSLLVYELLEYAEVLDKIKITRMWIHAVDEETLKKAFTERYGIELDMPYVEAAKARSLADVRVGFNFSRLFSMKGNLKASVGRVRTALMQIVRYREKEIEEFVSRPFYNIKGSFTNDLIADLIMSDNESEDKQSKTTTRITEDYYATLKDALKKGDIFIVADVDETDKRVLPDLLPNQNDILKSVGKLHKVKANKILDAMQTLYERRFISYPRTEKRFLPTSLYQKAKTVFTSLQELYAEQISNEQIALDVTNKRIFNDEEVEEHFAVVPWLPKSREEIEALDDLERKTYDYVVAKFLMACMNPYEYGSSSVVLKSQDDTLIFKATGKTEKSKGFKNYQYLTNKNDSKDVVLPIVQKGQKLTLLDMSIKKDTTKPPALLDEPELLEMMENVNKLYAKQVSTDEEDYFAEKFSLGTPATRAQILDSVINTYKYIAYNEKSRLTTTDTGKQLLDVVGDAIDLKMTAQFEREMEKIKKDKSYRRQFDAMMEEYVNSIITKILPSIEDRVLDILCPVCQSPLISSGKVFKCSKNEFKDGKQTGCKFVIFKDQSKFFGRALTADDLEPIFSSTKESPYKDGKEGIYLDMGNPFFLSTAFTKSKSTASPAKSTGAKKKKWGK